MLKQISFALCAIAFTSIANAQANPDVPLTVNGNTAAIPVELDFAYGQSLPGTKAGDTFTDPRGPSRNTGGEKISISFRTPKTISAIRLTAYSKSGTGKILIRNVVADSALMPELFKFADVKLGAPVDYQGLVMLNAGSYVETLPARPIQNMAITVEGFTSNDTTILVELASADGFAHSDFLIRRSRTGTEIGGYFDEMAYRGFTAQSAKRLMSLSKDPTLNELNNTTWVCSGYARNAAANIDFKTRHFFSPAPGQLQSTTDKKSTPATWILTQEGWKLPLEGRSTNCGYVADNYIMRITPSGNLIKELAMDRNEIMRACLRSGFQRYQIEDFLNKQTLRSVVSDRLAVTYYEFCRPAKI